MFHLILKGKCGGNAEKVMNRVNQFAPDIKEAAVPYV